MENKNENTEVEISLQELVCLLFQRWKLLLLGLIIGGLLAGGLTYIKTPVYESKSMLFILSKTTSITSMADIQIGSELSTDYTVIATSKPVVDKAIEAVKKEKNVTLTREEVLDMLTVANKEDTRIIEIVTVHEDPELACAVANAITEATSSQMAAITKSDPPTTVERAEVATEPVDNDLTKNTAVGALVGLILVAILVIVPYLLNDKIKTVDDVERYLEVGVLGIIPVDKVSVYHDKHKSAGGKKQRKTKAAK